MSDRTAPIGLEIKVNEHMKRGAILWLDKKGDSFAYTKFGDPGPPPGRAAFIAINPEDYDLVLDAILDGRISY
jgi:hypothetical protein